MRDFIGADVIIGHNARFDVDFLYNKFMRTMRVPFTNNYVDTLRISRKVFPELRHHRLDNIAAKIGYSPETRHRALAEYIRAPITKPQMTMGELYAEWQPVATRELSRSMQEGYATAWKSCAPLSDIRVRDIRTAQMQKIIDRLSQPHTVVRYGRTVEQAGLSHSALNKIRVLLNQLFRYAIQNDITHKNYAEFIQLPKAEKRSVKDCFSDLECARIEQAVGVVPYADWILCMIYTGFRIGEFLALTPFSVKETDGVLVFVGGSKTEAGRNRLVPVHPKIRAIIEAQRQQHGQTLFCRPDGSPMPADYFRDKLYKQALLQIGVRQEDMIALMGHADFSVDIDHYIKQSAPTLTAAVEKIQ